MSHDPDRLRGSDDGREPLVDPLQQYQPRSRVPWIGLIILLAVVAAGVWWFAPRSAQSPSEAVGRAPVEVGDTQAAESPIQGLGVGAPDPNLPPLGALDGYVRPLLAALSARPELAALLASDGLVRRFVVSVEAVSRGASPASQVRAIAPRAPFAVERRGSRLVIDPASYARYDGLVALVQDLDPDRLARLYGQLKPRLEEAWAELGVDGTFDEAMTRALAHLVQTPMPPDAVQVQQAKGTNFAFSDPRFENLSQAQRHLLRLGPDNARRVQERLRAFGLALGIPADRLTAN